MSKKFIALLIFLFLISLSIVSAGNNTTTVDYPTSYQSDLDTIKALESGDSNISFSDGYKGYCVEWGEHSAEENETFYVDDTSKVINKDTHKDVSNYLKVMFLFFYNKTQQDPIATQHMIWKFTDNKQFSRFDENWYNDIVIIADNINVPDDGTIKLNKTHELVYSFNAFIASVNEYQNYFGYKFFIRQIPTVPDTNIIENTTNINITYEVNYQYNQSFNQLNKSVSKKSINYLSTYRCGNQCWLLGCVVIMVIGILLLDNRK